MTYDYSTSEEEGFDRLVKRLLAKEWERFPAPSDRVWRALVVRLWSQAKVGLGAPCVAASNDGAVGLSKLDGALNEVGTGPNS